MNQDYPHDIQHFANGDRVPEGYLQLTREEFELLDFMTPAKRAEWLEENGRRSEIGVLMDGLLGIERKTAPDELERHVMRRLMRDQRKEIAEKLPIYRAPSGAMRRPHKRQIR